MRESFSLSVPFEATSLEDASNWRRCKLSDKRRPWDKSPFKDVDMMRQQKIEKVMQAPQQLNFLGTSCPKRVVCRAGILLFRNVSAVNDNCAYMHLGILSQRE